MKDKVRIGIIGTGFARSVQIPAFLNSENTEVVSIASAKLERAAQVAQEFNIQHFTDDWCETVRREDVDLISIVTPPNLHLVMSLYALEHGKHVLCEKPTAMNANEAKAMLDKANETNKLALIDHELRFLNGRRKAFEMIRHGDIGRIIHIKNHFRNASRGTTDIPWNWWSDETQGGGTLGAIGSHAIDSFRWFLGTEITEIFCLLKTNIKERPDSSGQNHPVTADDEVNLIVRFAENELTAEASGIASLSVVESGKYEHKIEIFGTEGGIIVEDGGEIWYSKIKSHQWEKVEIQLGDVPPNIRAYGWSRGFMNFAREIVAAIREERTEIPHAATFADGYQIQLALDAARKSSATGSMQRI